MKKNVIEQEAANGERWPSFTPSGSELFRGLTLVQSSGQTHPRRQRTQRDLATASINITQNAYAAPIVEMNSAETVPKLVGKPAQDNAHVVFFDVMNSVSARGRYRELNVARHTRLFARTQSTLAPPR